MPVRLKTCHSARLAIASCSLLSAATASAQPDPYHVQELGHGIFAMVRDVVPAKASDSNVLVIVNENDVVVVDANIYPSSARQTIAEIRKRTRNPVRYVVNTHYHSDHHYGNAEFRKAYPGVEFISHAATRDSIIAEDIPSFRKNIEVEYPAIIARYEKALATGKKSDGSEVTAVDRSRITTALGMYRYWMRDVQGLQQVPATLTMRDSLVLHRGERSIVVKWLGLGNTAGDVVVHLPKERIVATGDLVVSPVPFGFGSYLGEWPSTLRRLEGLGASVFVPGHGAVMRDSRYVDQLAAMFEGVWRDVQRAVAERRSLDDTRKAVDFSSFRPAFTHGDAELEREFDAVFATPIVEAAYAELTRQSAGDTVTLTIGSPLVDARVYKPHKARVRIRAGGPSGELTNEWVNELTLGDSAGRPVMRWVTTSMFGAQKGNALRQTYDGITLAPLGWENVHPSGAHTQLRIADGRVTGRRRAAGDSSYAAIDRPVERVGFIASASDLVPLTVGMRKGRVIIAPVWGPNMPTAEERVFTIVDQVPLTIEGKAWSPWKVEERRRSDGARIATWYLVDRSPYMVAGEMYTPDGRTLWAEEVEVP